MLNFPFLMIVSFFALSTVMAFYDARDRSIPFVCVVLLSTLVIWQTWGNLNPVALCIALTLSAILFWQQKKIIQPIDILFIYSACLWLSPIQIPWYLIGCGTSIVGWYWLKRDPKQPAISLFFGTFMFVKIFLWLQNQFITF